MDTKSPLQPADPEPMARNPSPAPTPSNPNQYPPPPSNQYPPSGQYPAYNPQRYTPQPYNPQDYPPVSAAPPSGPFPSLAARPGPETRFQDRPASRLDVPQKAHPQTEVATYTDASDLGSLKTNCQFALREYLSLQRQRGRYGASASSAELESRIRAQGEVLLGQMKILQGEVRSLAKQAENHRWRRWIIGGAIASFIPLIRRFWHRGDDEESKQSSNDTEYAFRKSQGLLEHIKNTLLGKGHFAKIAFLVFAVLYVFSNEVNIRVARTVQKRIKKLCARIERGDADISDRDMKLLEGWRWRVLLW